MKHPANTAACRGRTGRTLLLLATVLLITPRIMAQCDDWSRITGRAMPALIAAPKDTGIQSRWGRTDHGDSVWDLILGSDISIWQTGPSNTFLNIGARFIVSSRFQFNSESFNLWGSDFCGGIVVGKKLSEKDVCEVFLYHESSHLGDETLDEGLRKRIDAGRNGIRVLGSRHFTDSLYAYGGLSYQAQCQPADIEGVAIHLGGVLSDLPPHGRGYLAVDSDWWDWRGWNPDFCIQAGCALDLPLHAAPQHASRVFLQVYSGRVQIWQYWDETETTVSVGLANNW